MALAVGLFVGCLPLAHTSAAVVRWGFNGVIGSAKKVILTLQRLPGNRVRLSWPISAKDLTLQVTTGLQPQNWKSETTAVVNTATEHTVTVSSDGQLKLFRLVKLPL